MFEQYKKNDPAELEKQRQSWLKMRKGGKLAFVLYRGVILWGGTMFLIFGCMNAYVSRHNFERLWAMLGINAVIWFVGGLVWGLWVWNGCERRFGLRR